MSAVLTAPAPSRPVAGSPMERAHPLAKLAALLPVSARSRSNRSFTGAGRIILQRVSELRFTWEGRSFGIGVSIGLIALLKGDVGPWLWEVMRHVLHDEQAAREFADKLLVDGFLKSVMQPLASPEQYGSFFSVADFSDVEQAQAASFWNDEIHPTEEGFAVLAEHFNASIRSLLPAHKRNAVV